MPTLPNSARDWPSGSFGQILKSEIENLAGGILPLDKGTAHGGRVDDSPITVTVLAVADGGRDIQAGIGVFFGEIIAGCSCGDEPQTRSAYCEMEVRIDKSTGEAVFAVIPE